MSFWHKPLKTLNVFFLGYGDRSWVCLGMPDMPFPDPVMPAIAFFCPSLYPLISFIVLLRDEPLNASFRKTLVFSKAYAFLSVAEDEKNFCL